MPLPDAPPLSSEERALARRLAELHVAGEPSAALDARILAAARNAAGRSHRRRTWPAAFGLAASLLLAVGIAWRLRPLPPERPAQTVDMGAQRALRTVSVEPPPSAPLPSEQAATAPPPQMAAKIVARPPAPVVLDAPVAAPPSEPSLDSPSPMALPPPPPPAPPAETDPKLPARAEAATQVPKTVDQDAASAADAAAADSGRGDEPEDEVPPATADSPAVRDAWLQRIHGLVDSGDIAGARASLRAFTQRYPAYALPEDLRALAR
jgi:resuscitation-promoting factor RpfA